MMNIHRLNIFLLRSNVTKNSTESRYQFLVLNSLLKPQSLTTDEGVERYEYDSHGYLKQVVDKLGNISKTTFNENGLLVEQVSNVGSKEEKTTLSSYDTNLRKPLRVLENGVVNYYAYDKNGQLTSSIEAVVASFAKGVTEIKELRYEYNEVGQMTSSPTQRVGVSFINQISTDLDVFLHNLSHFYDPKGRGIKPSLD